jgi:hypothetical protein
MADLSRRIARSDPLDEAIPIARQIARPSPPPTIRASCMIS